MMRRIDLLPPVYAQRRRERNALALVALAVAVAVLVLVGWWFMLGFQLNRAERELADAQARNLALQQDIAELQRFVELENEVASKRQSLQMVMAGDIDWPGLLAELAMVLPPEVWLENLTASAGQTEGAAQAPTETAQIPISDLEPVGRVTFQGQSLSMPGVAKWLLRLEYVDSFFAVYLQSATEAEAVEGTTTFTFSSSLELSDEAVSGRFQQRLDE